MQPSTERRLTGRIARLRPDRVTLPLAALAVLSAALILAGGANYGVGVSTDSLAFASAAQDVASGDSPVLPNSPPLFPTTLFLADLLGFDPLGAAAYINAAAFGMTIFLSTLWLWRKTQSPFIVAWTGAALAVAPPLIHVTPWAISEPLFILLTLSALLTLDAFLESRRRSHLLLAAIFAALAFLTRYPGVAMVGAGVFFLSIQRNVGFSQRIKEAAVYATIALTPVCAWLLRNYLETGRFTGHASYRPLYSLSQNIESAAAEFWTMLFAWSDLSYAVGRRISAYADNVLIPALIAVAILAAVGLLAVAARRSDGPREICRSRGVESAFTMAFFVAAYTGAAIIGLTNASWSEGFGIRHFAPAYPPLALAVALAASACFRSAGWKRSVLGVNFSLFSLFGGALLALWLVPQFGLYAEQHQRRLNGPLGHNARAWGASPAVLDARAKALDGRATLGTNTLDVAPYLTGVPRDEFSLLPCKTSDEVNSWLLYADGWDREVYVVWFDGFTNAIGCKTLPSTIRQIAQMDAVARLPSGNVFRVSPATADPLDSYRSAYADAASRAPALQSKFDIHLRDGELAYLKESCSPADTEARFFLHVVPVNESDLSYDRRRYGFDNLNFAFNIDGARFDGKCYTTALLPNYPIARVATGQFVRGEGRTWEGEFRPSP